MPRLRYVMEICRIMEKRSGKWGNEENEAWEFFYVRCFACDAGGGRGVGTGVADRCGMRMKISR